MRSDIAVQPAIQNLAATVGPRSDCSEGLFRLRIGSRPQDLIPNGTYTIGLAPGSGATSISAGHEPICGPGWTWTSALILIRVLHGGLFPQDRSCDLRNDASLETVANRSVPMACGPNVDQACPACGAAALRVADLG
jgi:hypothetical protein